MVLGKRKIGINMKNIIIFLIFTVMLIAPLFKGRQASNIFIIGMILIGLSFLLLTSGCAALLYSPLL